jgi:phage terminase large subunit GpA-like protein
LQDRDRNEALDTSVLCHAAYRLLNPNIRQMLEVLGADSVRRAERGPSEAGGTTGVQAPAAAPSRPVRRRSESDYLRRNR